MKDPLNEERACGFDAEMNNLTANDIRSLGQSFITPEIINQAQLRRVTDAEGAETIGRKRNANSNYSGIVYPYFTPFDFANPRAYRLRRDTPDLDRAHDGTIKESGKYLAAPGSRNLVFFPPKVLPEYLADISLPIVITEGEKKGLALYRLATEDLTLDRWHFLPLAIAGVWNFRGAVGKTTSANGSRVTVKGFLPDFELIAMKGRLVSIMYDSNVRSNEMVAKARLKLAGEFRQRGAKVSLVDMPENCEVNGIDDLLGKWEEEHDTVEAIKRGLDMLEVRIDSADVSDSGGTQSARIIRLVEGAGAMFFHTVDGETFTTIPMDAHFENHKIKSTFFREWIGHAFWNAEGKVPSTKALQDAINALTGRARFASPEDEIFVRLAEKNGRIYLDLANEKWQVTEVSDNGWRIIEGFDAPVKFRRPKGLLPLPIPECGTFSSDLKTWINVSEEHFPLVAIWLIACFRTGKPFPVLILNGEQGSAKSTTSKVLRRLIDPNISELRTSPRDERDLMIAATNGWILAFDNLSKIPDWLSDALCRISTGGGFATRTLYENDEETMFSAKRPLILNGITELATRPDLLDRSLIINCPNISKAQRRDEETFWDKFEEELPKLLGSFLTALGETLHNLPAVKLSEYERMADFEKFGVAAETALGFEIGTFQRAYVANRRDAIEIAVESSATASLVIAFMRNHDEWTGTANSFLRALIEFADQHKNLGIRPDDLPKRANALSGELKKVSPNLRAHGIEFKRVKSGSRGIILQKIGESSSTSSGSSLVPDSKVHDTGDVGFVDDGRDDHRTFAPHSQPLQTNTMDDVDDVDDELHQTSLKDEDQERIAIMTFEGRLSTAEDECERNHAGSSI